MRLGELYSHANVSQLACLFGACDEPQLRSAQVVAEANSLALSHDAKESTCLSTQYTL